MEREKEVRFVDLIRKFNRRHIRYLVIGRRAVILYGGPVLTADHDLWIHPDDKKKTLSFLSEELGFELSHPPETEKPIVTCFSGMRKYDLFFQRSVRNIEKETIDFEQCYADATVKEDTKEGISFRIPSIDDLIRLKRIRKSNIKDEQDIEYLLKARNLRLQHTAKSRKKP